MSSVIKRMKHVASVGAYELWLHQSTKVREQRNKSINIVQKMLHRGLAMAFDGFASIIEETRSRRVAVQRALSRWNTPYLQKTFDHWLE